MGVFLIGGGSEESQAEAVYGGFLAEARERAGRKPRIALVALGTGPRSRRHHRRFQRRLVGVARHSRTRILLAAGDTLDPARLEGHDGIFVAGGLTPEYHRSLAPSYDAIRALVADGVPYAGFSAGAEIAASHAIIGGWLRQGVPVCPADAAEDLDELTVVEGIGLVDGAVEVHTGAWGTLSRLVAAVDAGLAPHGVALDENTCLEAVSGRISGSGRAWWVNPAADGVVVRREPA